MASEQATSVCVRVPGKINLQLGVGRLEANGYHQVATVLHAVSLFDEITVTPNESGRVELTVRGPATEGVPVGPSNLAVRAARLLAGRCGVSGGADVLLHKEIPVAAGMGGGSADAAATLVACDAAWGTSLPRPELLALAAELGSDVPFALVGGTVVGSGRGEQLTPALARGQYHWVLALSEQGLSTPAVYAEFDRMMTGRVRTEPRISDRLMQALRNGDGAALGVALQNDLQAAACSLRPGLGDLVDVGREYGALGGLVSGSGPTVAFLVRDNEHALDLSVALTASGACQQVKRVHGPVHGARISEPLRLK